MDAIRSVFRRLGVESVDAMAPNERYAVPVGSDTRLVFEKVGPARLSVTHRDIRMRDDLDSELSDETRDDRAPDADRRRTEIVYRIEGDVWIPIEYTKPPAVHRHDVTGLESVPGFGFEDRSDIRLKPEGI